MRRRPPVPPLLAGLLAGAAAAQPPGPAPVITVTARERPAPAAPADRYDAAVIARLDVRTIEDLRYASPSLYAAPSTFRQDVLDVAIRGQRNFPSFGLQFDTAAAVYADGVYLARPVGLTATLLDVDAVEVLKGPQGTDGGRAATAGAIRYTSNAPARDAAASARATIGSYGRRDLAATINLPLAGRLWARATIGLSRQRGYIANHYRDPATGAVNDTAAMGFRRLSGQAALKWAPVDGFALTLRGAVSDEAYTGTTYHDLGLIQGTVAAAGGRPSICNIPGTCSGFTDLAGRAIAPYYADYASGAVSTAAAAYNAPLNSVARQRAYGFWSAEQAVSNRDRGRFYTGSAQLEGTLGGADVRLLGAVRRYATDGTSQSRGLPYVTNAYAYRTPAYRSGQAELSARGRAGHGRLDWTAGLFAFREASARDGDRLWLFLPSAGSPAAVAGRQITLTDQSANGGANASLAAYARGVLKLGARTRLTAGARYSVDWRRARLATTATRFPATPATTATLPGAVYDPATATLFGLAYAGQSRGCALTDAGGTTLPLTACALTIRRRFAAPSWTLALERTLAKGLTARARVAEATRSGAINSQAVNPLVAVAAPERARDYELGLHAEGRLGRVGVTLDLAGYWTESRDVQVQVSLPNVTLATAPGGPCTQALYLAGQCSGVTTDPVTLNARAARARGLEASLAARPGGRLTIEAGASLLDAAYTDYRFVPPPGYLLPAGRVDLSGTRVPLPRWQASGAIAYALPDARPAGLLLGRVEASAHLYVQGAFGADRVPYAAAQRAGGYALLDARLAATGVGGTGLDLALFARNLTATRACQPEPQGVLNTAPNATFGVSGTSGVLQCLPLSPRTWGLSVGWRF